MNHSILYIDRLTGRELKEEVYGEKILFYLYKRNWFSRILAALVSRVSFFSSVYGYFQKRPSSKSSILPFIEKYNVNPNEFQKPVEDFASFNDFFCRKLRPESRPIVPGEARAAIPADGRYLVYQDISKAEGFIIKGATFSIAELLKNETMAKRYDGGSMMVGRLCPVDCHRFIFPCGCVPKKSRLINGWLYSVNPIALKQNIHILTQNKRMLTVLETSLFGEVIFLEVGATSVGSIHQNYVPGKAYKKGEEKGYFSFGGSALILLFEPGRIRFDEDLCMNSSKGQETRCLMGQSLGNCM